MKTTDIKCPKCERIVPFIRFGLGHVAVCCGEVLSSLSDAEAQVEEFLIGPDAAETIEEEGA